MPNPISSPADPIFYLHHTYLDKVWADWQSIDPSSRLYDIGGTNEQNPCCVLCQESYISAPPDPRSKLPYPPWENGTFVLEILPNGNTMFPGLPGGLPEQDGCVKGVNTWVPFPFPKPRGDPGKITTLGHELSVLGILGNVTIEEVMDIGNALLCYEYV